LREGERKEEGEGRREGGWKEGGKVGGRKERRKEGRRQAGRLAHIPCHPIKNNRTKANHLISRPKKGSSYKINSILQTYLPLL
jgi:hypothetical protein